MRLSALARSARLAAAVALSMASTAATAQPLGEGWLLGAESDTERWERVQRDLAGFSRAMWEVGYRYQRMHEAIADSQFELAVYQWEGLEGALNRGIVRRPGREENTRRFILDSLSVGVKAALESRDGTQAQAAFARVREACIACHIAEEVPFLNGQRLFSLGF